MNALQRLHLVSVVIGMFHTDDWLYAMKSFQQAFCLVLLKFQLFGIAEILKLTAAAFFVYGAAAVLYV